MVASREDWVGVSIGCECEVDEDHSFLFQPYLLWTFYGSGLCMEVVVINNWGSNAFCLLFYTTKQDFFSTKRNFGVGLHHLFSCNSCRNMDGFNHRADRTKYLLLKLYIYIYKISGRTTQPSWIFQRN